MRFSAAAVSGLLVLCFAAMAPAKVIWRTDKPEAIARLNDDLKQALTGATLNNQQRRELAKSQGALQQAVDANANAASFNTAAVQNACKKIETMTKADVFSPPDKKAIDQDLAKLRKTVNPPPRRRGRRF
jgi:hypothetical protein